MANNSSHNTAAEQGPSSLEDPSPLPPPPQKQGQPLPLEATRNDLLACQLSSWFSAFRHLPADDLYQKRSNVTIKSKIITELPDDFIDFLLSDGIRLPVGATKLSSCAPNEAPVKIKSKNNSNNDDDSTNWDEDSEGDDQEDNAVQYSFPELNQQLTEAIAALGGSVVPKLNWSAPKDATWVNEGTLKCRTPGDIYLLLKSSDFCMHDLQVFKNLKKQQPPESSLSANNKSNNTNNIKLELVLRKWCTFYPSMEFRCFVRKDELVGISQRNHTQHYPHLLQDKSRFQELILDFFDNVVCHQFANNQLSNYVFDVYIDKSDRVWLLDFNVWSIQTDALLFTWEELVDMEIPVLLNEEADESNSDWPELRVVETALEVRQDPLASYRAPMDTVQLASSSQQQQSDEATTAATTFESFMSMCQKPSDRNDRDNDSD